MKLFQLLMILFIPYLFYVVNDNAHGLQFSALHKTNETSKKADKSSEIIGVLKGRTEYE